MRLADHPIMIELGGEEIELHPSLRNALRLSRLPGGLGGLADQISQGSLTAALHCIEPHNPHPLLGHQIMDAGLETLTGPLLAYVMACAGFDPDAPLAANDRGKPTPYPQFLERLYKIGTGWLGWSPETTLEATPIEILKAHSGLMEKLKAIHGGGEEEPKERPSQQELSQKFRLVLGSLKAEREGAA